MMSSVTRQNIPGNAKAVPGSGEEPLAFPPESLFAFKPRILFVFTAESFSRSPWNPFRLAPESAPV